MVQSRNQTPEVNGERYTYRNESVFVPQGYLVVGRIVAAHALRGEMRIELHTDFPERFANGMQLFLGSKLSPVVITASRPHKTFMLVRFEGVNDRNAAEELRGTWVYVEEENAFSLDEDTFWVHDILGLAVETDDGRAIGKVQDVLFTGANEVYVVQAERDVNRGKDILLPAIAEVINIVDLEAGRIIVTLPDGLLDE